MSNIIDETIKLLNENKELLEGVSWDYYNKFKDINEKYLPDEGEGDTLASQIVTAINK